MVTVTDTTSEDQTPRHGAAIFSREINFKEKIVMDSGSLRALKSIRDAWKRREGSSTWRLTQAEWNQIKKLLPECDFVYSLSAHALGFEFRAYDKSARPGSRAILTINCSDFPGPPDQHDLVRELSSFTHTSKNAEALRRCGFEKLDSDLSSYPYA